MNPLRKVEQLGWAEFCIALDARAEHELGLACELGPADQYDKDPDKNIHIEVNNIHL